MGQDERYRKAGRKLERQIIDHREATERRNLTSKESARVRRRVEQITERNWRRKDR